MNLIEKQTQVTRELYQINAETLKALFGLTGEGLTRLVSLNTEFMRDLPQSRDPGQFFEMQREYGRTLLQGVREDLEQRGEILKSAFSRTTDVLRGAWTEAGVTTQDTVEDLANASAEIESAVSAAADEMNEQLEQISGIGAAIGEQLRKAGIVSLSQVAELDIDALADETHPLHSLRGRIEADKWIEQARKLMKPLTH